MALCHLNPFARIIHRFIPQGLENVSCCELPADSDKSDDTCQSWFNIILAVKFRNEIVNLHLGSSLVEHTVKILQLCREQWGRYRGQTFLSVFCKASSGLGIVQPERPACFLLGVVHLSWVD